MQGHKEEIKAMYRDWPFFAATIDLIEMILAKVRCCNLAGRPGQIHF